MDPVAPQPCAGDRRKGSIDHFARIPRPCASVGKRAERADPAAGRGRGRRRGTRRRRSAPNVCETWAAEIAADTGGATPVSWADGREVQAKQGQRAGVASRSSWRQLDQGLQAEVLPLLQGQDAGRRLQERRATAAVHVGAREDPIASDERCVPQASAADRGRDQARERDGAAPVRGGGQRPALLAFALRRAPLKPLVQDRRRRAERSCAPERATRLGVRRDMTPAGIALRCVERPRVHTPARARDLLLRGVSRRDHSMRKALRRLLDRLHAAGSRTLGGGGRSSERARTLVGPGSAGSRG